MVIRSSEVSVLLSYGLYAEVSSMVQFLTVQIISSEAS